MKARVILGLTIILPLLLALTSCQERGYQKVQLRTRPVRPFYPLALKKAQQWKPDAYLDSISVDALPRDDYSRPILLFFGFESPSDDRHSLLIIFQNDVDEPKVEHVYHEVAISARNPINIEDWSLDSTDVLAIAQDNGGDEFLAHHNPETTRASFYLECRPFVTGAPLRWRASYLDLFTVENIHIILDPQTGKVIEVKRYS